MTAREIAPKLFGLLVSAVDEGVDRLATHRPQTAFVSRFQPTRDLLGRPSFRKTIADESPQFLIEHDEAAALRWKILPEQRQRIQMVLLRQSGRSFSLLTESIQNCSAAKRRSSARQFFDSDEHGIIEFYLAAPRLA